MGPRLAGHGLTAPKSLLDPLLGPLVITYPSRPLLPKGKVDLRNVRLTLRDPSRSTALPSRHSFLAYQPSLGTALLVVLCGQGIDASTVCRSINVTWSVHREQAIIGASSPEYCCIRCVLSCVLGIFQAQSRRCRREGNPQGSRVVFLSFRRPCRNPYENFGRDALSDFACASWYVPLCN